MLTISYHRKDVCRKYRRW